MAQHPALIPPPQTRPPPLTASPSTPRLTTLPNGLRIVSLPMPWRRTVALSVFVRTGCLHESRRLNGISHVVEHMAFKGTTTRDCQRINLDAERLGAEVNAHTDRDHTAFHIEGLARDLPVFVDLLADIVLNSTFPADELERERQVILHELTEVEDDPASMAFRAFDRACYGAQHAAGRSTIGQRSNIERFSRDDLLAYTRAQYTAANVVVAAAGPIDPATLHRAAARAFGHMPAGTPHTVAPPTWHGGLRHHRLGGCPQTHVVIGFPAPTLADPAHLPYVLAATLLGEGMSSPLLDEIRERRGLAYYVSCAADVQAHTGQLVVEATTAPKQADEFIDATAQLLQRQATAPIDKVGLDRARNQLAMRTLRLMETPSRWLEATVQDLFTFGHCRDPQDQLAQLQAVTPRQVRRVFERLLEQPAAVALAGSVSAAARERATAVFGHHWG